MIHMEIVALAPADQARLSVALSVIVLAPVKRAPEARIVPSAMVAGAAALLPFEVASAGADPVSEK